MNGTHQYPGGKNGSGVPQLIINQIPPHEVFIETFFGSGAVSRWKKPAPIANVGIDIDVDVITQLESEGTLDHALIMGDAITFLENWRDHWQEHRVMVYHDPPYLMSTRSTQRSIYRHEFDTPEQHARLLELITNTPPNWMHAISGYFSEQYNAALKGWRRIEFQARTRTGMATECLWMNYPEPFELHDYRYLGVGYRERERIKKKKTRWFKNLKAMPALERYAVMDAIEQLKGVANG